MLTDNTAHKLDISAISREIEESFVNIECQLLNIGDEVLNERVRLVQMKERIKLVLSALATSQTLTTTS